MESTAAKREALQIQLQLVRDQKKRDAELSEKVKQDGSLNTVDPSKELELGVNPPSKMTVNGVEVRIGDHVTTVDDPVALARAEKGFLVSDPVKTIYLGEKGEVVNVFESFQGKPAVELRFADGVSKLFFVECITQFQPESAAKEKVPAPRRVEEPKKIPTITPQETVPEPPPTWGDLSLPKKQPQNSTGKTVSAPKAALETSKEETTASKEEDSVSAVVAPKSEPPSTSLDAPSSKSTDVSDSSPPPIFALTKSDIPLSCLPGYQAKFSLEDELSNIPKYKFTNKRVVSVGLFTGSKSPLKFRSVVLFGVSDLNAVLEYLSLEFKCDPDKEVKRLFTYNGVEIHSADRITPGDQLVATAGDDYAPLGAAPTSKASKPASSTTPPSKDAKPIHVRVFENGQYGDDRFDRAYITVTIRPTYKTMTAVRATITRELQWRDGRKVEFLFDASGTEIEKVEDIKDGAAIVASAGDRFVIPFPNTILHKEAMALSRATTVE